MPGGYTKNAEAASVIGDKLIVRTPRGVLAFDRRSGRKIWGRDEELDQTIDLTEDVVAIRRSLAGRTEVTIYDPSTGKALWQFESSDGGGISNDVYTADGEYKHWSMTRRDLHTGKPKWTITAERRWQMAESKLGPAASGSMAAYRGGPYVMLTSGEGAKDVVLYAVDAETGARHASMPLVDGHHVITDRTLVGLDPESRDCKVLLRGVDIRTGETRWNIELRTALHSWFVAECPGRSHALYSDASWLGIAPNTLFSIDAQDRPIALDLDTGVVRWRGPWGLVPVDADEHTVLVRDASGLELKVEKYWEKGRLAALDAKTGKLLWRATNPPLETSYTVTAVHGDIALDGGRHGRQITVRNARTGVELQPVEGSLIGAGPGWLVATYDDMLRYYTL